MSERGCIDLPARSYGSASLFVIWSPKPEGERKDGVPQDTCGFETDPLALARALSVGTSWREMADAILIARPSPEPALGVLGRFDSADEARLGMQTAELNHTLPYVRYVGYARAEKDCELLGARLVERFGRDELRRFCFTGVPRGGLIVLGMLSYVLGLEQEQLEPPRSNDVPLVVVDDCALTGSRFGRFLSRCESRQVIFANLYSNPGLRTAIETREPAVVACLSAQDLQDCAPESLGEEYAGWQDRLTTRTGDQRYWIGLTEHLCFPWAEPDRAVWDPVGQRFERGWPLVPPELCLKNRPAPGTEPVPVQVQPEGPGPLRPSSRVLFGELEGQTIVGNTETRESFVLAGVAADMWRAIVEHGSVAGAVVPLSGVYDVSPAVLEADLRSFVEDALARDLLERKDVSGR